MAANFPNMSNINFRELYALTSSSKDIIKWYRLHALSVTATMYVVSSEISWQSLKVLWCNRYGKINPNPNPNPRLKSRLFVGNYQKSTTYCVTSYINRMRKGSYLNDDAVDIECQQACVTAWKTKKTRTKKNKIY